MWDGIGEHGGGYEVDIEGRMGVGERDRVRL